MSWCLTKPQSEKFKQALKKGELDPFKLSQMESLARREFLAKFVGQENAKEVNALFESKLLLKNKERGYITWAKHVSGITPKTRMDLMSKIERMDNVLNPAEEEAFLQDLASTRLRIDVTQEEAKQISDLSNKVQELRQKANSDGVFPTETDRLKFGGAKVDLENYVNELKLQSRKISFRDQPLQATGKALREVPGALKSIVASLDNSLWGRQGIKTLYDLRTSKIWFRNFLKSWKDIGKVLVGRDAIDAIKADIYSRPNAINGKYKAGRYGLDVLSEEAFPSSLPEKIPLFGRLFKASEQAYNGGALRLRADLADRLIAKAERFGINTLDKTQAEGLGSLVSSITGRGNLGKLGAVEGEINVLLFSVKFFKSNFDTLTGHQLSSKATKFSKREAGLNLLNIVATTATILTIAKLIDPDSVDEDPRSQNFGKIKIFGLWTDITGGMASLVTLASRLMPTYRQGTWGMWKKSSTGNWTNLTEGKFGQQDAWDLLIDGLFTNKLSPFAGIMRDLWRGETFDGQPITIQSLAYNQLPISIQTFNDLQDNPNAEFILGTMILEGLGFSVSTYYYKDDWNQKESKEMKEFKDKVGQDAFDQANKEYNKIYSDWFKKMDESKAFDKMSDDERDKEVSKARRTIKNKVFYDYGYGKKSSTQLENEKEILEGLQTKLPTGRAVSNILSMFKKGLVPSVYASEKELENRYYLSEKDESVADEKVEKDLIDKFSGVLKNALRKLDPNRVISAVPEDQRAEQAKVTRKILVQIDPESDKLKPEKETPTPTPTPKRRETKDLGEHIAKYFPKSEQGNVPRVLDGENGKRNPIAENVNSNGSIDRGIFQINSDTFADFKRRKGDQLKKHGINSFDDMYDPEKNTIMASIIWKEQGWCGWYGSPDDLVKNCSWYKRLRG